MRISTVLQPLIRAYSGIALYCSCTALCIVMCALRLIMIHSAVQRQHRALPLYVLFKQCKTEHYSVFQQCSVLLIVSSYPAAALLPMLSIVVYAFELVMCWWDFVVAFFDLLLHNTQHSAAQHSTAQLSSAQLSTAPSSTALMHVLQYSAAVLTTPQRSAAQHSTAHSCMHVPHY